MLWPIGVKLVNELLSKRESNGKGVEYRLKLTEGGYNAHPGI